MIDEKAQAEFAERFVDEAISTSRKVFTPEVIDAIANEFSIPNSRRDLVAQLLEVGAQQWSRETRRAAFDFKRIRKELRDLERATKGAKDKLATLSAETREVLNEAGVGRTLGGLALPRIVAAGTSADLAYSSASNEDGRRISLDEVGLILAALAQCAADAQPMAGANKTGRPEGWALSILLQVVFQVWESILSRPYRLDWTRDGTPITDAARFSTRIARIVDPSQTLQQISTAARKVREESMSFKDLEEVPQVVAHYRKRFE